MTNEIISKVRDAISSTWNLVDQTGGVENNPNLADYAVELGLGLESMLAASEADGRWGCLICDDARTARHHFRQAATYLDTNVTEEAADACGRFLEGCSCGN